MTEPELPGFDTRFEWSAEGAVLLARVCRVVVVVDVLRFTTAVEVAVARERWWFRGRGRVGGPTPSPPPRSSGSRPGPGSSWRHRTGPW